MRKSDDFSRRCRSGSRSSRRPPQRNIIRSRTATVSSTAGYGYNGYGNNGWGQVRALQARIDSSSIRSAVSIAAT